MALGVHIDAIPVRTYLLLTPRGTGVPVFGYCHYDEYKKWRTSLAVSEIEDLVEAHICNLCV